MEDKLRKFLKEIADKQINLASEFAREQILSDILRIVNVPMIGIRNVHIQLCHDFKRLRKENIGKKLNDSPKMIKLLDFITYLEETYPELENQFGG